MQASIYWHIYFLLDPLAIDRGHVTIAQDYTVLEIQLLHLTIIYQNYKSSASKKRIFLAALTKKTKPTFHGYKNTFIRIEKSSKQIFQDGATSYTNLA